MKNSTNLKELLAEGFQRKFESFASKLTRVQRELGQELNVLRTNFGNPVIDAALKEKGINPNLGLSAQVRSTHATGSSKRQGRRRHVPLSELKPLIVQVIRRFETGKEFTLEDVRKGLRQLGVGFDPSQIRLILPRYVGGIRTVRKSAAGEGRRKNIYVVDGNVSLIQFTKVVRQNSQH